MEIGQTFFMPSPTARPGTPVTRKSALGDWNDLPPNITPGTEEDFWMLLRNGENLRVIQKQPYVSRAVLLSDEHRLVPACSHSDVYLLQNCKLWLHPDLSGMMVVWEWSVARNAYDRFFYHIAACKHPHRTSVAVGKSLTRYDCPDCGFSTTVDSSD